MEGNVNGWIALSGHALPMIYRNQIIWDSTAFFHLYTENHFPLLVEIQDKYKIIMKTFSYLTPYLAHSTLAAILL